MKMIQHAKPPSGAIGPHAAKNVDPVIRGELGFICCHLCLTGLAMFDFMINKIVMDRTLLVMITECSRIHVSVDKCLIFSQNREIQSSAYMKNDVRVKLENIDVFQCIILFVHFFLRIVMDLKSTVDELCSVNLEEYFHFCALAI